MGAAWNVIDVLSIGCVRVGQERTGHLLANTTNHRLEIACSV
jgi:hypothetical protein